MTDIILSIKRAIFKKQPSKKIPGLPADITIRSFNKVKQVVKPWGFELWLADGTNTPYAFKLIYLKKGTKTSLQYHKKKKEHNCILSGRVRLYYQDANSASIEHIVLSAGNVIAVNPPAVHRIEALTDVLLAEASTNQLDDVIRLADDYSRPDGKIKKEHVK